MAYEDYEDALMGSCNIMKHVCPFWQFGANTCSESEACFDGAFKMFIPERGTLHVTAMCNF